MKKYSEMNKDLTQEIVIKHMNLTHTGENLNIKKQHVSIQVLNRNNTRWWKKGYLNRKIG